MSPTHKHRHHNDLSNKAIVPICYINVLCFFLQDYMTCCLVCEYLYYCLYTIYYKNVQFVIMLTANVVYRHAIKTVSSFGIIQAAQPVEGKHQHPRGWSSRRLRGRSRGDWWIIQSRQDEHKLNAVSWKSKDELYASGLPSRNLWVLNLHSF